MPPRFVVLLITFALCGVLAMDIGHHNDVTHSVFHSFFTEYSSDSRDIARIASWFVDYFCFIHFLGGGNNNNNNDPQHLALSNSIPFDARIERFQLLHTNSLHNASEIQHFATQFIVNVRASLASKVRTPQDYMVLLGLTMHVQEDLHSHSNWGQSMGLTRSSCSCFRNISYWGWQGSNNNQNNRFFTGSCSTCKLPEIAHMTDIPIHGDYCTGMNRDSYERPGFDEGYVGAFVSLLQWVPTFEHWAQELATAGSVEAAKKWAASTS